MPALSLRASFRGATPAMASSPPSGARRQAQNDSPFLCAPRQTVRPGSARSEFQAPQRNKRLAPSSAFEKPFEQGSLTCITRSASLPSACYYSVNVKFLKGLDGNDHKNSMLILQKTFYCICATSHWQISSLNCINFFTYDHLAFYRLDIRIIRISCIEKIGHIVKVLTWN